MKQFLYKKNNRLILCYKNNRRHKRLLKFDKTHNWHLLDIDTGMTYTDIESIYYYCRICDSYKRKCYSGTSNSYYIIYGFNNLCDGEYNCMPCKQAVMKGILE